MKKKLFGFLMMVFCITLMSSLLVSCNKDFNGTAPVYQGMTISKLSDKQDRLNAVKPEPDGDKQDRLNAVKPKPDGDKQDRLNAVKPEPDGDNDDIDGDHNDKDDNINQDKPFGDEPTIEDKVDDTLNVGGAEKDIYYADPNEEILIAINIHNPDSYEILSFTLNGKKYQSFEFQDGSNSEKLLLKLNVGAKAGIVNYTIDSIKYIVSTDIKDVIMDGNKTVQAGVRGAEITNAEISQEIIGLRDISFNAKINDEYKLINPETGFVKAVLYNGKDLIKTIDLTLGDNAVKFDSLSPNTLYEYGIVAKFDDFSGSGTKANVIKTKAFYTNTIVLFDKSEIVVTQTSIAFDFVWDSQILPQNQSIESFSLYLDDTLVAREISKESKVIDNLLSNRTYKIVATYKNLTENETISITAKTQAKVAPIVELNNLVASKTEIEFAINITDTDMVGSLSSIQLYKDTELVETLADTATRKFSKLLSDTTYTIKVTYTYDLNNGAGEQTLLVESTTKTQAKVTPILAINDLVASKTEIEFAINITDTDTVGSLSSIQLYKGTELVDTLTDTATRKFSNLLSETSYTIKVTYTYDLNNGAGEQTLLIESTTKTQAKVVPILELNNLVASKTEIDFAITITDTDTVGSLSSIQLFKGTELVETLADLTTRKFSKLLSDTTYTIKVIYTYDLNNGAGEQTLLIERSYYTAPVLEIISVETINTSSVSIGENVVLQAKVNNPSGYNITKAVINGVTYNVSGLTSATNVRVEIMIDNTFYGGNTNFVIESLFATVHDKESEFLFTANNSSKCFINGEIFVDKIEMMNSKNQFCDVLFNGEENYILVTLKNSTGYSIDGLTFTNGVTRIIKIDDNHYKALFTGTNVNEIIELSQIVYSNANLGQKTKKIIDVSCKVTVVPSEPVQIKTAQDLKNMSNFSNYKLMNDIDLAGIEWSAPGNFNGYFDGNGYTISNLKCVTTFTDTSVRLGLFARASGVIKNLKLENVFIMSTIKKTVVSPDSSQLDTFIGGLSATSNNLTIVNCSFSGDIGGKNEYGGTYVGGLVGQVNGETIITESFTTSNISADGKSNAYAGGLIGYSYGNSSTTTTITNCYTTGNISATYNAGGLVGYSYHSTTIITNCYTTGNISATGNGNDAYAGGLIGWIDTNYYTSTTSAITITSCYTTGNISAAFAGGLIGYSLRYTITITITNCYTTGNISAPYAGGLIGCSSGSTTTITNCYTTGNISATGNGREVNSGGLIGYTYGSTTITNCYTTGNISATCANGNNASAGGLIGSSSGSTTITNCYTTGNISATYNGYNTNAGGLIGVTYSTSTTITSCYTYTGQIITQNNVVCDGAYSELSTKCALEQLNSLEFYTLTLKWDSSVWNFTSLDFTKSLYPTLK